MKASSVSLNAPSALLFDRFPNMSIHANLVDAHVYIFAHWVLKLLADQPALSSIKLGWVPFLVQAQFSPKYKREPPRT